MEHITLPGKRIPVLIDTDVVVIGGGPAGFASALTAAREGVRAVLIERYGCLGGMFTNGMMCISVGEPPQGLPTEILGGLARMGCVEDLYRRYPGLQSNPLFHYHGPNLAPGYRGPSKIAAFDPHHAAHVMMELMEGAGGSAVRLHTLFVDTQVQAGHIEAAIVESSSGRRAIKGKVFIDATGRGDVVARSGGPFVRAGNESGMPIAPGLMWKVSYCDCERLFLYQKEDPLLEKAMERARANGDLPRYRPKRTELYGGGYAGHPRPEMCPMLHPGDMLFWAPAVYEWKLDCAESDEDLTRAEIELRRDILAELRFLTRYVPGFEKARLAAIAPYVGVREGRHPVGEHVMSYEDIRSGRTFEDAALRLTTWDRMDMKGGNPYVTFEVPYRSFLLKGIDNLLLAGDNLSMTHEALLQIRGLGTALRTGEVAGRAAARAVKEGGMPRDVRWDAPL